MDSKYADFAEKLEEDFYWLFTNIYDAAKNEKETAYIENLRYSESVARAAIRSFLYDIARMAEFSPLKNGPSDCRLAAYFAKWISKFRPFYFYFDPSEFDEEPVYDKEMLTINERLALMGAFSISGFEPTESHLPIIDRLLYSLHFRAASGKTLSLILESLTMDQNEYKDE